MKSYRLEYYKVGNETRYFWTIETESGSTITLTMEQFGEMLMAYGKVLEAKQHHIREKINKEKR